MKHTVIQKTLKAVFDQLTKDTTRFIDWYGYKTAEIEISGIKIGVGIHDNFLSMKIFTIRDNYEVTDDKRFKQTFRMGHEKGSEGGSWWSFELAQANLGADQKSFYEISKHLMAVSEIAKMIETSSSTIPAE